MKRILIAAGLSGMLMPAVASAELNYNIIDVGFASKMNRGITANFTEFNLGVSKNVLKNLYLGASFQTGTQTSTSANSSQRVHSTYLGAGFHTPLNDDIDVIVPGHVFKGTDQIPGSNESANGYDIGAGVRARFEHGLEGSIVAVHSSISKAAYSSEDAYVYTQFGFDFAPNIQLYGGIDLWRGDQTMNFGLHIYY